jgi:hypothetical protein
MNVTGPTYEVTRGSFSARHPGATVQLTLTPQGPMVDGSRREPFKIDIVVADLDYGTRLGKIAVGAYRVTASLQEKNGTKLALQCARSFDGKYDNAVDIFWECSRDDQETRADPAIYLKE